MASALFLILTYILLTAPLIRGQTGSCPLDSCSLVSQVNICTNETAGSGGCSDSCVMALRGSSTVDECCNVIEQSITNAPTRGQNGGICGEGGTKTQFGVILINVNGTRAPPLAGEILEGTYVVDLKDFMYSCNGCIKSIQLAVSPTSAVRDAQMQEKIKFHTFANKTGDKSIFQSIEDVIEWRSSVVLMRPDRHVVEYRPSGSSEVCFSQGDMFGFTIETGSSITLLTRRASEAGDFVRNASSTVQTISGCPRLSDNGLYTTTVDNFIAPLILIVTGGFPPTEPPLSTTDEPPSTESSASTQTATRATPDSAITPPNTQPLNTTDPEAEDVSPPDSGYVIYIVSSFTGVICILLIVEIIVVVLAYYILRKRQNRITQYGKTCNASNSISMDNNAAYGVSNIIKDGDHMDSNEAYGISIGVGDHMDSNEAYGISIHVGAGDHMKNNVSYGVLLQQTDTLQEFEDDTPHEYDYPMVDLNNLETEANEAYGTAMVQQ